MKHLIKTVSFMAVMTVIPGAFAATSRASIMGAATSRLPSIAGYVRPVSVISGTTTTTATSTLGVSECMDEYSECIRQEDVCGENFEECTTNVLFHLQMPKCDSVLLRCNASGVSMLFGSGAQFSATSNNLSTVESYVEGSNNTEVAKYKYPLMGEENVNASKLGEWIQTAWKVNSLDVQQCSKKYTTCLKRDSVCGPDFELCTSKKEFKKQAVFCASTLARCSVDGKKALFGSVDCADKLGVKCNNVTLVKENGMLSKVKDNETVIDQLIIAGAGLAAGNAVNTCYKVADQCILRACGTNPARCMIDKQNAAAEIADYVENNKPAPVDKLADWAGRITNRDAKAYIKNVCLEPIGNSKYCYMTHVANGDTFTMENGKAIAPEKFEELVGKLSEFERQELYDEVFDDIYATRMKTAVGQRIADLMADYDAKTRDKCAETIRSCVMQTCGGGIGSVCYSQVFKDTSNKSKHINDDPVYSDIQLGCQALVSSDPNCQYSAVVSGEDAYWTMGESDNVFATLFPKQGSGGRDLIGVIASLEGMLSTSYNDASIEKMKKQCATTAISCVKSMCGKDYSYCFRNRTDITSGLYDSDTKGAAFAKSMNKQGGVLDYNIVNGLCLNTIKNAKVCEEHLKIEAVKEINKMWQEYNSWGRSTDVRSGWLSSLAYSASSKDSVTIGCRVNTDDATSDECKSNTNIEDCGYVDDDGCMYDEEVTQSYSEYAYGNAALKLFQETLLDLEKEAQAKYNAKLTKEQNICLGNNNGGIRGAGDNGSVFMWVKLKSKKVPGSYAQKGLQTKDFTASNDLHGSFCRARVTVVSDDQAINEKLGDKATAYFAVGDAFECGSWIDTETLKKIEDEVRSGAGMSSWKKKTALAWSTVGGLLTGGTVGGLVGNYLANGQIGGNGLLNSDAKVQANNKTNAGSCVNNLDKCLNNNNANACRSGLRDARAAGINVNLSWGETGTDNNVKCEAKNDAIPYIYCSSPAGKDATTWCTEGSNMVCCKESGEKEVSTGEGDNKKTEKVKQYIINTDYAGMCYNNYTRKFVKQGDTIVLALNVSDIITMNKTEIEDVYRQCQEKVQNNKSSRGATIVGTVVGAAAGAGLGIGIAKTVIDAKDAQAKDKRVAEWKAAMGEHIRCYLGSEDLAGYGEYVSFNFEDMN